MKTLPLSLKRGLECLALVTIGDSVLGLVNPRRHVTLWRRGPQPWQRTMDLFIERPRMTRALCAGALALGLLAAESLRESGA